MLGLLLRSLCHRHDFASCLVPLLARARTRTTPLMSVQDQSHQTQTGASAKAPAAYPQKVNTVLMSQIIHNQPGFGSGASPCSSTIRVNVPVNGQWCRNLHNKKEVEHALLLHVIERRWISYRGDAAGTVRLKHDYLRALIPDLVKVRARLVENGVIDVDKCFVPGVRSMGYTTKPEFRITRVETYDDAAIARRIAQSRAKDEKRLQPVHRSLRENLTLPEFDLQRALAIVYEIDRVPPKRRKRVLNLADYHQMLTKQCRSFHEELTFGRPELHPDKHGRVHTSISRLPGVVRGCLSIDGEPLVGCDLKNAQPLLLGLVAARFRLCRHGRGKLLKHKPMDKNPYGRRQRGGGEEAFSITTTRENLQTLDGEGVYKNCLRDILSVIEYLEVCESGQLYESLATSRQGRDSVKQRLLIEMNDDGSDPSSVMKRFEQKYPSVYGVMTELKKENYRRLSWILQNLEARIFIGRICQRLTTETPEIPVLTVHDSIMTTSGHFDTVKVVALEEFARLGLRPTFQRETYC